MEVFTLLGSNTYVGMMAYLGTAVGAATLITGMVQHYKNIIYANLTLKQWSVVLVAILLCETLVMAAIGFSAEALIIGLAFALAITGNVSLTKEYRANVTARKIINKN